MNKYLTRLCSVMLTVALVCGVVSVPAMAADSSSDISFEMSEATLAELEDSGITVQQAIALHDITIALANAQSAQEVDALLDDYYELVAGTPLAASAAATSFYSSSGGTIYLDYTGSLNLFTNVIHTKAVYLPANQVVYYQSAMSDENFLDFIEDEGISIITGAAATKIAAYLGVASSSLTWLIGASIGVTIWILQNLELWDINDAIDNSTTGKLKLEFFYMTSVFSPYYQEFRNFEPWNSSYVDVPADYDYTWSSGVYDY